MPVLLLAYSCYSFLIQEEQTNKETTLNSGLRVALTAVNYTISQFWKSKYYFRRWQLKNVWSL